MGNVVKFKYEQLDQLLLDAFMNLVSLKKILKLFVTYC